MTRQLDTQPVASAAAVPPPGGDRYGASKGAFLRSSRSLAGGVSSNFRVSTEPFPLFFESGSGSHLTDIDGNDYVDYVLGMGPAILGHAPAAVVSAVKEQVDLGQLFAGQTIAEVELAERFVSLVPSAQRVRFGSSGTEMVQAALRLARAATERDIIVKFEGHYHGWLDPVLASIAPPLDDSGPDEDLVPHLPSLGQLAASTEQVAVLRWNDTAGLARLFDGPRRDRIAAVICEPILCNTCVIPPEAGFLEQLRELTSANGSLLIFDEVITGFRVALGGAQAVTGVTPDLAVFAKAMGSGFPIAAVVGSTDVMELTSHGVLHGGTYNANTSSVAAANATLATLAADDGAIYRHIDRVGSKLMDGLRETAARLGSDLLVQGLPGAFNTTFGSGPVRDYPGYAATDRDRQRRFLRALQDRGVRVTSRGTWFLSAAHDDDDIERTLASAAEALTVVG